jgi:hypothetical protein
MEQAGSLKNLAERMREKAEQERIETEKVFSEQLQTLKDNLQASSQNALRTMSDAMGQEIMGAAEKLRQQYQVLSLAFGRKWIGLAILGVALCLGMAVGGWALTGAWAWRLAGYQTDLELAKQALANLKGEMWNLELRELPNGRFIVFPPGKKSDGQTWKVGDRDAIRMEE